METATSQLTAYIIWACLGLAILLVVAQVIVSVGALAKAKTPAPTPDPTGGGGGVTTLDGLTLSDLANLDPHQTELAAVKIKADVASSTAALDLLGKLSSHIPLAVGGILLILIALVANGALGAELVLGPGGTPSGG